MDLNCPKDYAENLAWRRKLLLRAKLDPLFQMRVRELFHRDPLFAFNAFFFTLDVRRRPEHHQPFCTYEFQDEVILKIVETIDKGEDLIVEKSRDMGASWMVILVFLWYWLRPSGGVDFLLGSRIEDYVDKKGDMRTLMQKARYAFYKLPKWLWPKDFSAKTHDNFMRLQNPETGSAITGESNNANFSTGGRYAAVLFDEFAKWEGTDKSAWMSAGDATPSRIAVSTSFGAAGQFYDLVSDPLKSKLSLHWSLHPLKAEGAYCFWPKLGEEVEDRKLIRSPWYDRECQRRSALEVAQELDMDYIGSGNPVFDGKAMKRIMTLRRIEREPEEYCDFNLGELTLVPLGSNKPRDSEGFLVCYKKPNEKCTYAMGVDVVEGVLGGDYAVVKLINRVTKDVDAGYFSRINEIDLSRIIATIAKFYTTFEAPWVGVETNASGLSTFDFCYEVHDITNLFMMPVFDSAKQSISYRKGWRTTESSKNVLVGGIKNWLLDKQGWCDSRLCKEMTTFIHKENGKAAAREGSHDDEVMAFGIALQVDIQAPQVEFEAPKVVDEVLMSVKHFEAEEVEEPKTVMERCLAQAVQRIEERGILASFGEDGLREFDFGWQD